ncbi:hypothetical protein CR513_13861, partial [Mucuna pruriens]
MHDLLHKENKMSKGLEIIEYFDFDFAGCQDNKRFMSRYIYMLAGRAISWKFIKQTLIVSSTMIAKHPTTRYDYKTLSLVCRLSMTLKIYCDNNSVVFYSNNSKSYTMSKFIDINFM